MRLMIVGQKWMGAKLLEQCVADGHSVLGVAAPRDDDALAICAAGFGIPVAVVERELRSIDVPKSCDVILAAHAHCFISALARDRARYGALGYHPSLLPRHRGRDAIRWAIHMRETQTGGTLYWMDDGADTGPIALQDWCHIGPEDTAAVLWRRDLAPMGLRLFRNGLALLEAGALPRDDQDDALATWEPSFNRRALKTGTGP